MFAWCEGKIKEITLTGDNKHFTRWTLRSEAGAHHDITNIKKNHEPRCLLWFRNCSVTWRKKKFPCHSGVTEPFVRKCNKTSYDLDSSSEVQTSGNGPDLLLCQQITFLITKEENLIKSLTCFQNRTVCLPWICLKILKFASSYWILETTLHPVSC